MEVLVSNDSEFDDFEFSKYLHDNWTEDFLNGLDISQFDFPNTLWHIKPAKEVAVKISIMLIVAIVGIFLNSIIIIIIIKNKWLWTSSNFLICNLAVTDALTLLLCPWTMLVRDFYQSYELRSVGCKFEGFMQGTLLLAGVGSIHLVSYDRLAAAALTSDARITKSVAWKLIFLNWTGSAILSLPWILKRDYMERQWANYLERLCVEETEFLQLYWHFMMIFLVWLPLGVMILSYGGIIWRISSSAKKLSSKGKAIKRAKDKAIKISSCVLVCAAVCRIPYTVLSYWRNNLSNEINSVDGAYSNMWFAASFLLYLNCGLNPLIYGFTNIRFRRAMDRTTGIACFRFGSWCCYCQMCEKTVPKDGNTEKIFIIDNTSKPNKRLSQMIKNVLHINQDSFELNLPKVEEGTTKPTKVTPLKSDD